MQNLFSYAEVAEDVAKDFVSAYLSTGDVVGHNMVDINERVECKKEYHVCRSSIVYAIQGRRW